MVRQVIVGLIVIACSGLSARAADLSLFEQPMYGGKHAEGEQALKAALAKAPNDDQLRFGLGTLQVVAAIEHLGQALFRYGLDSDRGRRMQMPFLRLPVPTNPKPDRITYQAARQMLEDLVNDLAKAEATLAPIRDPDVKLPVALGLANLDFVGNGAGVPLRTVLAPYLGGRGGAANLPADDWQVVFDRGDVAWLRGYCHLLTALAEVVLAHDLHELFDCTAHIFFIDADTPNAFLAETDESGFVFSGIDLRDAIAFVHLLRFPVEQPQRMESALGHLKQMLSLSRSSWEAILAETDDDHEWLPNPKQHGMLGVPVQQEMVDSWLEFVDEGGALLEGTRLVPFWRGSKQPGGEQRGVNLKRVFTEPRTLDVVLWVQGSAAIPYLEQGPLTKRAVWERMVRIFGGEFVGFAIWFN